MQICWGGSGNEGKRGEGGWGWGIIMRNQEIARREIV